MIKSDLLVSELQIIRADMRLLVREINLILNEQLSVGCLRQHQVLVSRLVALGRRVVLGIVSYVFGFILHFGPFESFLCFLKCVVHASEVFNVIFNNLYFYSKFYN